MNPQQNFPPDHLCVVGRPALRDSPSDLIRLVGRIHDVILGFRCRVSGIRKQMTSGYRLLVTGYWPEARREKSAAKKLTPETIDTVLSEKLDDT